MYPRFFSVSIRIKYLFRADSRTPDQVYSKDGFLCRDPYANLDVKSHVIYGGASNFISTSLTIPGALHNIKVAGSVYVYKINATGIEARRVEYLSQSIMFAYREEAEVLVDQLIPWEAIEGWYHYERKASRYCLKKYHDAKEFNHTENISTL